MTTTNVDVLIQQHSLNLLSRPRSTDAERQSPLVLETSSNRYYIQVHSKDQGDWYMLTVNQSAAASGSGHVRTKRGCKGTIRSNKKGQTTSFMCSCVQHIVRCSTLATVTGHQACREIGMKWIIEYTDPCLVRLVGAPAVPPRP